MSFPDRTNSKQLSLWADPAMHSAAPQPKGEDCRVRPTVRILQATPDPLGTLAAIMAIYKGGVKRSLTEVSDDERREALSEMLKTKLQGPLESIVFTILIEGVSRSFTHQMVRGRAAFYAQESMRFAVPDSEDWEDRTAYPPNFDLWAEDQKFKWRKAIRESEWSYMDLVNSGIPAEDARGLMPHAMTTRLVWQVSLRELLHVAGLRLCTQAQFEWRTVLSLVVRELRAWHSPETVEQYEAAMGHDDWQFNAIADLLRPVCYAEGKCGFMSALDRSCTIRERVNAFERAGIGSEHWGRMEKDIPLNPEWPTEAQEGRPWKIEPAEWLADPNAAKGGRNG